MFPLSCCRMGQRISPDIGRLLQMKPSLKPRFFPLILTAFLLLVGEANAQESPGAEASETRFTISEDDQGLTINFDGKLFAKYNLHSANKPYLWPIIGPTGKSMTRAFPMEDSKLEKKNQRDHPHHRGMLFGHERIERYESGNIENSEPIGGDTWHEKLTYAESGNRAAKLKMLATIKHRDFKTLYANDDRAVVVHVCDYFDAGGRRILEEERTLTFGATAKTRTIDFEQKFVARDSDVVFHDRKDAGLAIRVPSSMAVKSKLGGHVINSVGEIDGDAWSKPAKWCDYHGPVEGEHLGIAILNHPNSYRFPTRWHVRQYGLFAANPFGSKAFDGKFDDATTKLKQGESLELRHRFIFHLGNAEDANIEEAWQQYGKE